MIKFVGRIGDGKDPVLGLGLAAGDLVRLRAGEPLFLSLAELGLELRIRGPERAGRDGRVLLFYGESEDRIEERCRDFAAKTPLLRARVQGS